MCLKVFIGVSQMQNIQINTVQIKIFFLKHFTDDVKLLAKIGYISAIFACNHIWKKINASANDGLAC
jgi:hypothetical protein